MSASALEVPSYATPLLLAFTRYVAKLPSVAPALAQVPPFDPDERVPTAVAHALLEGAIALSGDAALGLKVGRGLTPGDLGVADYVVRSASTVRDAIAVTGRYLRLVNDAHSLQLEVQEERVVMGWQAHVAAPRGAEDFLMSGVFTTHLREWLGPDADVECWFTYASPEDQSEHHKTFPGARLRWNAPHAGYTFESSLLERVVEHADEKLHAVLRKHAEMLLEALPTRPSFTERVRRHLMADLPTGHPTASATASRLKMSTRTLDRRLKAEGATFGSVLDDLRQKLALSYLEARSESLSEIAFMLGFSHVAGFHRAFKRWTGTTPAEHRQAARAQAERASAERASAERAAAGSAANASQAGAPPPAAPGRVRKPA